MALFSDLIPLRNPLSRRAGDNRETGRFVVPAYEFKQSVEAFGLEVFVPGVRKDDVDLQVEKGELVVTARRRWQAPESWSEVFRESADFDYQLRVDLNDAVNVDRINAELEHGVLRVTLPKAEAYKARRIEVS